MEKLQPLITHRFWVIFGAALLLPVIGWWVDTGKLVAEIDGRWRKLDGEFNSAVITTDVPNKDWIKKLSLINDQEQKRVKEEARSLWDSQKQLMVWPADIHDLMADIPYRGEILEETPDFYRDSYFLELDRMLELADPYDEVTGEGKVEISLDKLDPILPRTIWTDLPPTSEQMWDVQEDIWLFSAIISAIADTNKSASDFAEAPVKQIQQLSLMGGSPKKTEKTTGERSKGGRRADSGSGGGGGRGFRSGRRRGSGASVADAQFNPTTEFGKPRPVARKEKKSGKKSGKAGKSNAGKPSKTAAKSGRRGKDNRKGQKLSRYVDDDEKFPFKTRAFYLHVVMDHRRVPELLAQLTSMPWPARIVRVHQVEKQTKSSGAGSPAKFSAARQKTRFSAGRLGENRQTGGLGADNSQRTGQAKIQKVYQAALADPYLADVVVGGLMTLYRLPETEEQRNPAAKPGGGKEPNGQAKPRTAARPKQEKTAGGKKPAEKLTADQESQPKRESDTKEDADKALKKAKKSSDQ